MTQPETPDPLDSNDSSPEINNSEQTSRREFMAGAAGMMAAGSMASDNSAASDAVDVSHLVSARVLLVGPDEGSRRWEEVRLVH